MLVNPYALASGVVTDPNFANVVMLLGFEGPNAGTTITDESPAAHGNASIAGSAALTTAQQKFGTASVNYPTAGSGVHYADHADFELGTGSWTAEFWYRPTVITGDHRLWAKFGGAGTFSYLLWQNGANIQWITSTNGSAFNTDITVAHGFSINTWYLIRIDFDGTKTRIYKDGVMIGSTTTTRSFFNGTAVMAIGNDSALSTSCAGQIDEFRLTKTVARCGSDLGYTPDTAAFPRS